MKRILVIGSLNIDIVANVDHIPKIGETILANSMDIIPGGKGANQACAIGRLGGEVTMFGAVGNDIYANIQLESLKSSRVRTSRIIKRSKEETGLALVTVNNNGDNNIVVIPGANKTVSKQDVDENIDLIKMSDIIIFQLEISIDTVIYAMKKAKQFKKMVILDPAPAPKSFPKEIYQYVDIIKPNESELDMLIGNDERGTNISEKSEILKSRGLKNIIVTLGGGGVYINSELEGKFHIPAKKVKAIDTTAAGDAFIAGLAVMLIEGKSIKKSAEFANLVSSIVVTRKGAQSSIPTKKEISIYTNNLQEVNSINNFGYN